MILEDDSFMYMRFEKEIQRFPSDGIDEAIDDLNKSLA